MIDWTTAFESAEPNPPLHPDELARQLAALRAPLDDDERAEVAERFGIAVADVLTRSPVDEFGMPDELLELYRWCDGGDFAVGERRFAPVLRLKEIREYMISYGVVHVLPGCIPFAMDGGGCFYLMDLRQRPGRVIFGGMNELDQSGSSGELATSMAELLADRRDPVAVLGL